MPIDKPAGTTTNVPAGITRLAGSAVTPSDANQADAAVAVAASKWSSTVMVESAVKPPALSACSNSFTSMPSATPTDSALDSTGVAAASPSTAITGRPSLQNRTVPVATLPPAAACRSMVAPARPETRYLRSAWRPTANGEPALTELPTVAETVSTSRRPGMKTSSPLVIWPSPVRPRLFSKAVTAVLVAVSNFSSMTILWSGSNPSCTRFSSS